MLAVYLFGQSSGRSFYEFILWTVVAFSFLTEEEFLSLKNNRTNDKSLLEKIVGNISLPITEQFSNEILSLPIYPELELESVKKVCDILKNYYAI